MNNYSYTDYVCPECFKQLDKCDCEFQPWGLINIDSNIQEQIRILNEKGYKTTYCCESHSVNDGIYISFACDYGIGSTISIPNGFVYRKSNSAIYYTYSKNICDEEFQKQKNEQLKILLKWCSELPRRN